jgi:hypothetical protein
MDEKILEVLKHLSKMISADSGVNEKVALNDLIDRVQPVIDISIHATGGTTTALRAIRYVCFTHAFPRCGASVDNYIAMLEALMEIVFPVAIQNDEASSFLDDIQKGVERAKLAAKKFAEHKD